MVKSSMQAESSNLYRLNQQQLMKKNSAQQSVPSNKKFYIKISLFSPADNYCNYFLCLLSFKKAFIK